VNSVVFSPDGKLVVSGSSDRTIRVWDAREKGAAVGRYAGHTGPVKSIAFSPDGARVASGSADRTVRIWDISPIKPDSVNLLEDWSLREDGWVISRASHLLSWVPTDLRTGLMRPRNTAVIHGHGSLKLGFCGVMIGEEWQNCYLEG
jgi:WD40 repeat protein